MSYVVLFFFSFTFLCHFYFYVLVIFLPACIFYFFPTVCFFSHFLYRSSELLSLYFSSFLCWFTKKLSLSLSHCAYFLFLPFFLFSFFPTLLYFKFFFLLFQCKADDSRKFCGIRSLALWFGGLCDSGVKQIVFLV